MLGYNDRYEYQWHCFHESKWKHNWGTAEGIVVVIIQAHCEAASFKPLLELSGTRSHVGPDWV